MSWPDCLHEGCQTGVKGFHLRTDDRHRLFTRMTDWLPQESCPGSCQGGREKRIVLAYQKGVHLNDWAGQLLWRPEAYF